MEPKVNTRRSWVRGRCIGRGAYGTVNLGVNISTGAVFAVKSVHLSSASPSQVNALKNEITILKSLSSPFVVNYLGEDTTIECSPASSSPSSSTTSFVRNLHMEYLPPPGNATTGLPDEAIVASDTWCLVSALSHLHSRGIVHCNVKGKNVLLGRGGSAKLADFGSAMKLDSSSSSSSSLPRGSPLWMAPEVIRGERQGPESDVWSLGCTVIEMLTGKPAWEADVYSVHRIGYSDELPLFPARLSSLGLDFLSKCLQRDYTNRWSCDRLLRHPFISKRSHKNLVTYASLRCVLDWFSSDFQEAECESEREEDLDENVDLGVNKRIRGLALGEGVNWESDGWFLVREGGLEQGSAPTGRTNSNSNLVVSSQPEQQNYSPQYDVVVQRCHKPGHFYRSNSNNIASRCSLVKRLYKCNNFSYLSCLYVFHFICFIFSQFPNFISSQQQ